MIDEPPFEDLPHEESGFFTHTWWAWLNSVYDNLVTLLNSIGTSKTITFSDSPYTPGEDLSNLVCDTTDGIIVVNYPAGTTNKKLRVTNSGEADNYVKANANGSELIYGESSQYIYDQETLDNIFAGNWW